MKKFIIKVSTVAFGLGLLTVAIPTFAATVNVCPVNGNTGIFTATGPITVSDHVMNTPAFAGDPTGGPSEGPFWPVQ